VVKIPHRKTGADVGVRNEEGFASLHFSGQEAPASVCRLLPESGADVGVRSKAAVLLCTLQLSLYSNPNNWLHPSPLETVMENSEPVVRSIWRRWLRLGCGSSD
jgi:hypothetical protein